MEIEIHCPSCGKKMRMEVDDYDRYTGTCSHCDEFISGSLDQNTQEKEFKPGVGMVPRK